MKLELTNYTCAKCGDVYSAPSLGETAYGEFLLWSENGGVAYLNAFQDPTYKEVDNLIKVHPKTAGLQPLNQAKVLRRVYGKLACDRGRNGEIFSMDSSFPCPVCGSQKIASWEFPSPPIFIEVDVQPVSHFAWSNLTDQEKRELLDLELAGT
jgi:predicted RNA-binding Zn-ribbon protein involved in translation (DUF1610 family)